MALAELLLLFLQVCHIMALGLAVFYLIRYYKNKKFIRAHFKHSVIYGLWSIPFAILIFFLMLHYGTMLEAVLYSISIIVALLPLIMH